MIVTEIEAFSSKKSRVYLDGAFAFVLYKGELHKYGIEKGRELTEDMFLELTQELLPRRAKLRAMALLKSRRYTERQLMDKLLQGGCPPEIAEEALRYVKSFHYVDDGAYAYDYLSQHGREKSPKELEQKLLQRGIGKEEIARAMETLAADGALCGEEEAVRRALEKRRYPKDASDEKEKRRVYAYLYRRGFSPEAVRRALEEYAGEAPGWE